MTTAAPQPGAPTTDPAPLALEPASGLDRLGPPTLPCVIDVEASGFGAGSYPIEVGLALPDGRAWCTLIRPAAGWTHWDGRAEALHGITRALLEQHGREVNEVAQELNRQLAGRTVYCDNWAHDYAWLARLFEAAGLRPAYRLQHLRQLLDDERLARFDATRDAVLQRLALGRHRASNDARALQMSVAALCRPGPRPR